MFYADFFDGSLWWIFPLVMIILCFFMMRGRMGSMCGFASHGKDSHSINTSDSALEILDKRYTLGEINKEDYEEKKRTLTQNN